jgi:hypothetical protein
MIVSKDAYTSSYEGPLSNFGSQTIQYTIRQYRDVRNLGNVLGYLVACKQRVIIPNQSAYTVGPNSNTNYVNYPAAVTNSIALTANNDATVQVKSIFPVTLNAAINTSQTSQSGTTSSTSNQSSSGSNQSQTNTFGVSLSAGFFGDLPMGGLALDYQHGWESGSFTSNTSGSDAGRQSGASSGESMSVKDWSSYGFTNTSNQSPTWVWGQTYPWDVIQYNQSSNGSTISLPAFVEALLLNNGLLLPPSQLSLFGLDLTMKAGWLVEFPGEISASETISLTHKTTLYTASHSLVPGSPPSVSAVLQSANQAASASYSPPAALDLSTYALDPIWSPNTKNGATIGFTVDPFTYPPKAPNNNFKILSPANNLQVTGTGFNPLTLTNPPTSAPYLSCNPATSGAATSFTAQFKILDSKNEYHLHLMHWIGAGSNPCIITVTVNGTKLNPFYVDSLQGQGGQNNMTSIELRNLDFQSPNYHDYLVLGLNTVTVAVTASASGTSNLYTLFALAVGQG